jgi:hypothetical protein
MWDDNEGMFYDHLCLGSGAVIPVKARSMVGMIPLLAVTVVDEAMMHNAMKFGKQFADFPARQGFTDAARLRDQGLLRKGSGGAEQLHRDQPYVLHLEGTTATVDYEPAESTTGMFGGNSNGRGPIWLPLISIFTRDADGRRPCFGWVGPLQDGAVRETADLIGDVIEPAAEQP